MSLIRKLFYDGEWNIAIRKYKDGSLFSYEGSFKAIPHHKKYWFADPLVYNYKGVSYLFCEAFDRPNYCGIIGYFVIDENGGVGEFKELIKENYHLSFPCVFERNGKVYMLPESGENEELHLYEAKDFPNKWEKVATFKPESFADPTVFIHDNKVMVFIYSEKAPYVGRIYELDMDKYLLNLVETVNYEENVGRPAGYFFKRNGELYRPTQNSRELYGKSLCFNKINSVEPFKEECVLEFDNSKVIVNNKAGVDRIHTYSCDDKFECIDYNNFHFDLFKRFKIMKRAKRVKQRKEENRKAKV